MQVNTELPFLWRLPMARNGNVPELLERFMEESGKTQCWITVNEIRTYFNLDEPASPAISGFLQRLHSAPFFSFPYRVERIEKTIMNARPHPRVIKRYLVVRRPAAQMKKPADTGIPETCGGAPVILTDYDAIRLFDRVLEKSGERLGDPHRSLRRNNSGLLFRN